MELLEKLTVIQQRDIKRFVDSTRYAKNVDEVTHLKWVTEAMEMLANTTLTNCEKRNLVVALYADMSKDDTNEFKETFPVKSAIELIWDVHKQRFGITVRKQGCCVGFLPCCSDVSMVVDHGNVKVDMTVEPDPVPPTSTPVPPFH